VINLGEAEEPWWKKTAQSVMDTVRSKIEKQARPVQPNLGANHPEVISGISERFRSDVLHIYELGKFKSEKDELSCYGVVLKQEPEFEGMGSFRSIFTAYSEGKAQFATAAETLLLKNEMTPFFIASDLEWFAAMYTLYKEFATTKPWVKFNPPAFEDFTIMKARMAKK
jgi:hypothetical protein